MLQPGRLTSKEVEALQPLQLLTHVWVSERQQQQQPVALLVLLPPVPASAPRQPNQQQQEGLAMGTTDAGDAGWIVHGAPCVLLQLLVRAGARRVSPAVLRTSSSEGDSEPGCPSSISRVLGVLQMDESPVVVVAGVVLPAAGSGVLEVLLVRSRHSC
jgi:hypothetical protein